MEAHHFDPKIITWYLRFLKTRICSISIKGVVRRRFLSRGVPQGGILSPLLWNLIFDELVVEINRKYTWFQAYADDGLIIARGRSLQFMASRVQKALTFADAWLSENGLSQSPTKTTAMVFSRKESLPAFPKLYIGNQAIEYVTSMKYLGLLMDPKLTFRPHIRDKFRSAKRLIYKSKKFLGSTFGPRPRLMLWAVSYTHLTLPTIYSV